MSLNYHFRSPKVPTVLLRVVKQQLLWLRYSRCRTAWRRLDGQNTSQKFPVFQYTVNLEQLLHCPVLWRQYPCSCR